jgi:hypothetical protein
MAEDLYSMEIDPEVSPYDYLLDKLGYYIETPDFMLRVFRGAYVNDAFIGVYEEGTQEEFSPIVVVELREQKDASIENMETYAITDTGIWLTFHPRPPQVPRILNRDYHLNESQADAVCTIAKFVASSLEMPDASIERE